MFKTCTIGPAVIDWTVTRIGFGIGAFFSLMSASFAYEDPYLRAQNQTVAQLNATQKAGAIFKEMGKGMWTSGKGFAKVGALFAGIECVIESVRSCLYASSRVFTSSCCSTGQRTTSTTL